MSQTSPLFGINYATQLVGAENVDDSEWMAFVTPVDWTAIAIELGKYAIDKILDQNGGEALDRIKSEIIDAIKEAVYDINRFTAQAIQENEINKCQSLITSSFRLLAEAENASDNASFRIQNAIIKASDCKEILETYRKAGYASWCICVALYIAALTALYKLSDAEGEKKNINSLISGAHVFMRSTEAEFESEYARRLASVSSIQIQANILVDNNSIAKTRQNIQEGKFTVGWSGTDSVRTFAIYLLFFVDGSRVQYTVPYSIIRENTGTPTSTNPQNIKSVLYAFDKGVERIEMLRRQAITPIEQELAAMRENVVKPSQFLQGKFLEVLNALNAN
jgi:hypothetical protein